MKMTSLKVKLGVFVTVLLMFLGAKTLMAKEPQTIVFLTWKPNQPEVWDSLIELFHQENPQIRVKVQVGPHSSTEYHAVVTQRLKNKDNSVDVFFMDVIWPPEFASAGWALDLTSRFSKEEQKSFLTPTIKANTHREHIYGVPCYLGAGLFYYRTDLLSKYKLDPPRSWSEMLSQGQVITEGEREPALYIFSAQFKQYEGLVCNMLEFIWSHGGSVVDPASRSVLLDRPDALEAVTFVRDQIIGKAAPRGAINYEEPESLELFIQGRAVFHRNWPYAWAVANDPEKSRIATKVGVGALPAFEGHNPASTLGGWQFGISRWSRHPDEAWEFVKFMTSFNSQKRLALDGGLAPTRIAVYENPHVKEKMPHLRSFLPAFKTARPRPMSALYPMISSELQRFFSQAIAASQADIQSLAKGTSKRIERILGMEAAIQQ
jgi:multiple sugar transport system substrate-binding protein